MNQFTQAIYIVHNHNTSDFNNSATCYVTNPQTNISHNPQGIILVSEHFKLKLDVEDFIAS